MKKIMIGLIMFAATFAYANGNDVIGLKNKIQFCGTVLDVTDSSALFTVNGIIYEIPTVDIDFIALKDSNTKAAQSLADVFSDNPNLCMLGQCDAEMYHGKTGGAFVLGMLVGPFAVIGYALTRPDPYDGKNTVMMSHNSQYFSNPDLPQDFQPGRSRRHGRQHRRLGRFDQEFNQ